MPDLFPSEGNVLLLTLNKQLAVGDDVQPESPHDSSQASCVED